MISVPTTCNRYEFIDACGLQQAAIDQQRREQEMKLSSAPLVITDRGPEPEKCPHCRKESVGGTHNGCVECGKVRDTKNGKLSQRQ